MDFSSYLAQNKPVLLDGALAERLKREYGIAPHQHVAWGSLIYSEAGRNALSALWKQYIRVAEKYRLPFAAVAPTRRANKERVGLSEYNEKIISDNIDFLKGIRKSAGVEMFVGGLMGCKGDAYKAEDALLAKDAREFHAWQADLFARAGADFLYAGLMPALPEAIGMAKALEQTGLPYIISFMIRGNGRLIDGTSIDEAIARIDGETHLGPACYMVNCVHPSVLYQALTADFNDTDLVRKRFHGIQANASPLSPEELDASEELKTSDCIELAEGIKKCGELVAMTIVGGCCGTDHTHLEQIAKNLRASE